MPSFDITSKANMENIKNAVDVSMRMIINRYDFKVLIEMLDLYEEADKENDTPVNTIISEYITGGMKWITEQDIHKGGNFSALKSDKQFSNLFTD